MTLSLYTAFNSKSVRKYKVQLKQFTIQLYKSFLASYALQDFAVYQYFPCCIIALKIPTLRYLVHTCYVQVVLKKQQKVAYGSARVRALDINLPSFGLKCSSRVCNANVLSMFYYYTPLPPTPPSLIHTCYMSVALQKRQNLASWRTRVRALATQSITKDRFATKRNPRFFQLNYIFGFAKEKQRNNLSGLKQ